MVHYLKLKNFFSFKDNQLFSLDGGANLKGDTRFLETLSGKRTASTALIYGGNASGKTNLLKAFYFLHEFIENSWRNFEQSSEIPIYTFAFTPYPSNTAEFELCTESLEGNVYKYNLKLNKKEVIEESLRVKEGHKTAFSHLFQRNETIKIYTLIFPKSGFEKK